MLNPVETIGSNFHSSINGVKIYYPKKKVYYLKKFVVTMHNM